MSGIVQMSLTEVADAIRSKKISAVEATQACIDQIDKWQPKVNAFVTYDPDGALSQAKQADADLAKGNARGPLHGVPLAHKDLFYRKGTRITCASKILGNLTADYDATVLRRLADAGAVHLGGLNMSELAMGAAGRNEHFGHCRNPWNPDHITGGSSSGSGASVAAHMVFGALGTDTGGSIRIPSAMCGVVGIKGTFGRVSRRGVMPLSYSLDNAGPMTRTVKDCARMFGIVAGVDPDDPSTANEPVPDYEAGLAKANVKGLRIGVPTSYFYDDAAPSVRQAVEAALEVYRAQGAIIVDVDIPDQEILRDLCNVVLKVEAANIHADWLRTRTNEYSTEVRSRIEGGLYIPGVRYLQAQRLRGEHVKAFCDQVFDKCDVLHTPGLPIEVPTLADTDAAVGKNALAINEKLAWCTRGLNYLGLPGLSVPCGFSANGLPVSQQLIGPPFSEDLLFEVGHAYQRETDWHTMAPGLPG
ncbi:MAG: amidase [Proteobacteria bacterium]|nr:amidase [Pseudomonadota bacterium]MDA1057281.1 amidase [Pseudomonadota bacterium]